MSIFIFIETAGVPKITVVPRGSLKRKVHGKIGLVADILYEIFYIKFFCTLKYILNEA